MSDSNHPPKSGAGGFIVAAVVMLVAMGALIFWKLQDKGEPTKPAALLPVVEEPPAPKLEAPPPPPPPLEKVEDAGKAPVAKAPVRVAAGPCSGECTGTAPAALQGALRAKAGASRGCYERALRQNPMLKGRIMVGVRVGAQGQVCSAGIVSDTLGDPGVSSCVLGTFRSGSLPPPVGGCAEVQVPMNFVPKTEPET
jgi:hypothetical protein